MYNNYSTNNYNYNSANLNSHLVRYDQPVPVAIGCGIFDMHALIIVNTYDNDNEDENAVRTWRIPLTGPEMQPWTPYSENDNLLILPMDRHLTPRVFRVVMAHFMEHVSIEDAIEELDDKGFVADVRTDTIQVHVNSDKEKASISSSWFHMNVEHDKGGWFRPDDLEHLFLMAKYLKKPLVFMVSEVGNKHSNATLVNELTRLMVAYNKGELLASGKVCHDGTYCYSKDLGRVSMTHDEFIAKFPDAGKLVG